MIWWDGSGPVLSKHPCKTSSSKKDGWDFRNWQSVQIPRQASTSSRIAFKYEYMYIGIYQQRKWIWASRNAPASPASKLGLDHPLFRLLVKQKSGRFVKPDCCQKSECISTCCGENCKSANTSEICQSVGLIIQIFHGTSQIPLTLSAALSDDQCRHS